MKKIILSFAVIAAIGFTSCSSDDDSSDGGSDSACQTCDLEIFGFATSTEYCDNGDGTYTYTTEGQSVTEDLPEGTSFDDIISAYEAAGATCN
ncbi:hypothetical protein HSX10_07595 [Winogradskyella undariae]|uniref:hypothetical protein n=1 Tax=Winogradskyella TaxID=286104 RepID=UPI00156B438B|nr:MULTISPECIES: hypothetical protein [Winogradskyella]NRR91424.1 hypothetical protein [Winogradskyella undariae]QNK76861.1 hypothetical protein H7F37_12135 [Winogradskyella sp. PAMC22761]QXP80552.1 hypothetical protein H0I32_08015 [Winogradskyella sp. HaHa_3_26]